MITVITGKVGSGKSLLGLVQMVDLMGRGLCVISNYTLRLQNVDGYLRKYKRRPLGIEQCRFHDFEEEPQFQKKIPFGRMGFPVTVFIDEAQLYYNAAEASKLQAELKLMISFLTQSRKCAVDVVIITQHETTVWAQMRHQCLFGYRCRDMRVINLPIVGTLPGAGLKWSKFDTQSGETLTRGRTPLNRELFGLYDTSQMYDSHMRELQAGAQVWEPLDKDSPALFPEAENSREKWSILQWLKTH